MELAVEVECDRSAAGLLGVAVIVRNLYAEVGVIVAVASVVVHVAVVAEAV